MLLKEKPEPMFICCICRKKTRGWGNNPAPIIRRPKDTDMCCDDCNVREVLAARMQMGYKKCFQN